jgi:hypothetical protein
MTSVKESEADDVVGVRVHAASITKFLWGVAATLVGAFVIASLSFAWRVNSDIATIQTNADTFREKCAETRRYLDELHSKFDEYPPAAELTGIRVDVSQLQYSSTTTIRELNDLTRQVRDLHPWPMPQRGQTPPAQTP